MHAGLNGIWGSDTNRVWAVGPSGAILRKSLLRYRLQVTKAGNGSGLVASTPLGVECGDDCGETLPTARW